MRLGAAVVAGVLTGLCFPPFGLGPLVLVALVPLLWAWRGACPAHAALYGFAYGIAAYVVVIRWSATSATSRSSRWSSRWRWRSRRSGAIVAAYGAAGTDVAVPHRRGVGGARGAARPLAVRRVPVGRGRRRAARPARGAGTGQRRRHAARRASWWCAVNGLLLDLGSRCAARARTRSDAVLAGVGVVGDPGGAPSSSTSPASSPPPPGTCGSRCSRATTSSCRSPSR